MGKSLGEFEQLLLFALLSLPEDEAYGLPIRDEVERRTGRAVSTGAVYTALDRLAGKGLVTSHVGEPTPMRGGRRKRLYRLEPEGAAALDRATRVIQDMSRGLQPRLQALLAAHGPTARRDS
ncbi:MAG: PadR family transcriptional regulator [Gemmatimonadales bacterium]